MKFLPYFLPIYSYVGSRVLSEYVHMEGMIGSILDVYHLLLVYRQFHYLVYLNVLWLCILLMVGFYVEILL